VLTQYAPVVVNPGPCYIARDTTVEGQAHPLPLLNKKDYRSRAKTSRIDLRMARKNTFFLIFYVCFLIF
jgi:hypothetical protein